MQKDIDDFSNPFDAIEEFENTLSEFTGAPGVILTDSCTHAMELGLRYNKPKMYASIPAHTYLSVPMTLLKLGIDYLHTDEEWDTHYRIQGSDVWDCANYFKKDMFEKNPGLGTKFMCLSFGHGKPLEIGHGGAILTDNKKAYRWFKRAAYDGRNLSVSPWEDQEEFDIGYHYMMRPEDAVKGLNMMSVDKIMDILTDGKDATVNNRGYENYPDLRKIKINNDS